jgi:THO complex subunit 2
MIQHGILELDAIYKMLGPTDEVIQAEAEKAMSEAKEFVRKMNIVSTKDKDEKSEDANSEANKKVIIYLMWHFSYLLI